LFVARDERVIRRSVAAPTVRSAIESLESIGIVREITGKAMVQLAPH
jgi:hypothetical protein